MSQPADPARPDADAQFDEHDTLPPSMDPALGGAQDPPSDFWGIVRRLGPGLIIAGSIVGSGELIATTKTGAQAGISLLWLIVIGCLIKVFVQIELGRHSITHGETTLSALDRVPGPRMRVNWIVWFWFLTVIVTIGQLGGIVGGVGQALAITYPIRGDYIEAIAVPSARELKTYIKWHDDLNRTDPAKREVELKKLPRQQQVRVRKGYEIQHKKITDLGDRGQEAVAAVRAGKPLSDPYTWDDRIWSAIVTLLTIGLLYRGRYRLIQNVSTVLVVAFTFLTIGNVVALQMTDQWRISMSDFMRGLGFGLPEAYGGQRPVMTALATFGIIGVGATELIAYPYWCIEKGYARFTGKRDDSQAWASRALGWMRVMRYDAFVSMVVYTTATLAFFVMGVAVLYNEGRDPEGMRMVATLATAYAPVFGEYARWLFLIGAVAVLYSTFLVANASNARMLTDGLKVFKLMDRHSESKHDKALSVLCVVLPTLCLAVYMMPGSNPVFLVIVAGTTQATLLPMIGFAALYFRYTQTDARLRPKPLWDVLLIVSFIGLLIAGAWGVYSRFT